MTEDRQSITAMVEFINGALRMLTEQVGKLAPLEKQKKGWMIIISNIKSLKGVLINVWTG
jgi:hypothetical protein